MTNKKAITILTILGVLFVLLLCSGCNKQIIDLDYTYGKAVCTIGNERLELEIDTWNDYDGEQIQIKTKDGETYLLSMNNCYLVKGN